MITTENATDKWSISLLIASLGSAILFDYLFYAKISGISIPLFLIITYGIFFYLFPKSFRIEKTFAWFLTIPTLLLSFTFVLYSSEEFTFFNTLLLLILYPIQLILLTKTNQHNWYKLAFYWEVISRCIQSTLHFIVPLKVVGAWFRGRNKEKETTASSVLGKVFIGLLFAVPLILFILGLLTSADLIFNQWINAIPDVFSSIELGYLPDHLALIIFVFFCIFAFLWSLHLPVEQEKRVQKTRNIQIDGIVMLTIFVLIDIVYLLFTSIQVSYLFGAAKRLLPEGVTYAVYATQGFNQLVTAAVLNILLVIIAIYWGQKNQRAIVRTMQVLLSLLTVCTIFILIAAFQKLALYESVYGFTYTRVLVHAFMILLSSLLIATLVKIWKNDLSLLKFYLVLSLTWYVILNYINIDHFIAKQNIAQYYEKKQKSEQKIEKTSYSRYNNDYVDIQYLSQLSYDVIPQLVALYKKEPTLRPYLETTLLNKKYNLARDTNHWQTFNFSKHKAKRMLEQLKLPN